MVVVKWLAWLPSTLRIQVRFPMKQRAFSVKFVFENNDDEVLGFKKVAFFEKVLSVVTHFKIVIGLSGSLFVTVGLDGI